MPRIALLAWSLAALTAAACQKAAPTADEGAAKPSSGESATTSVPAGDAVAATVKSAPESANDGITMRYACDQGHSVAIVRGEIARVSLADGRVLEIPRIADSSPPSYSGVALSFEVGSTGATLGQHEVGGFACREAD
jgi:hypothetical protein